MRDPALDDVARHVRAGLAIVLLLGVTIPIWLVIALWFLDPGYESHVSALASGIGAIVCCTPFWFLASLLGASSLKWYVAPALIPYPVSVAIAIAIPLVTTT